MAVGFVMNTKPSNLELALLAFLRKYEWDTSLHVPRTSTSSTDSASSNTNGASAGTSSNTSANAIEEFTNAKRKHTTSNGE